MSKNSILIITGPTSSGKSELAKRVVLDYKGVAISADSRQVYRQLDLGTGKDKTFHQEMIDIVNPEDDFSIATYQSRALSIITKLQKKNYLPVIVGGTGYYLDSILYENSYPNISNEKLVKTLNNKTLKYLENKLEKLDYNSFIRCKGNKRRIIRALEIVISTGEKVPKLSSKSRFQSTIIIINPKLDLLKDKIKKRIEQRMKLGMIKEVGKLRKKYSHIWLENLGLEYKYISNYLDNKINLRELQNKLFRSHLAYVKRQITWFRRYKKAIWCNDISEGYKIVEKYFKEYKIE